MNEDFENYANINTSLSNTTAQSNNMILARQNLSLNEAKLMRVIITQVSVKDKEFEPYEVNVRDLAKMFGHSDSKNLYHRAEGICDSIMSKRLELRAADGSWEKLQWVSTCKFVKAENKIYIKLNDDLRELLLNLVERKFYTQYKLEEIIGFNSIYAIRLFELLMEGVKTKTLPRCGSTVEISKNLICDACMLYKTDTKGRFIKKGGNLVPLYSNSADLKKRVIDVAVREINEKTTYSISVEAVKKGRSVVGYKFFLTMDYYE